MFKRLKTKCGIEFKTDEELLTANVRIIVGYDKQLYYSKCAKCEHLIEEAIVDVFEEETSTLGCILGTKVCIATKVGE